MYRLFIAEDNELARRALKQSILWEKLGLEFCGEATNGVEALALLEQKQPDIILMDIKMPGMNGLDVINRLREKGIESLVVIISAYDDFTYMRQGMQMGVFDYILKPIEDKELYAVLEKAVNCLHVRKKEETIQQEYKEKSEIYEERLKEVGEALEEKWFLDAINGSKEAETKIAKLWKTKYRIHDYFLLLIIPDKEEEWAIDKYIEKQAEILLECNGIHHVCTKGVWLKEGYLVLLSFENTMFQKEYNLQSLRVAEYIYQRNYREGKNVIIAISHMASSFSELTRLFGQVMFCQNSRFFLENQNIIHYDSLKSHSVNKEYLKMRKLDELYESCRSQQTSVKESMEAFLNQFLMNEVYDIDYVKNIFIQAAIMMLYIYKEVGLDENEFLDTSDVVNELSEIDSLQSAVQWMMDFADRIETGSDIRNRVSPQTRKIMDYLNEHYMETISLQDVADYMEISGTHVSRLIKNDIGDTFITLLNKIRIKESMRLLKTGDYKVYEIAEMVGYSNYAYFYQIFKKHTGVSPKDYV